MSKPLILTTPKGKAEWPHLNLMLNPEGLFHTKLILKNLKVLKLKKLLMT